MQLLNKSTEKLTQTLQNFINRHSLVVGDEQFKKLIHLLHGCASGKYKWQNLSKYYLKVIIDRNIDCDLQEFYIEYLKLGTAVTLKKHLMMYGDIDGNNRWKLYCDKQSETNTFEYKNKKYGMSEEEFLEYNKSRSVTLDNCIARHGVIEGTRIFDEYCKKQSYVGCKLEYFIEVYGEDEGNKRYTQLNKDKAITIENMVRVHGETGVEKYHSWRSSVVTNGCKFVSGISQELFEEIDSRIDPNLKSMFSRKNKEFGFYDKDDLKAYLYDYVIIGLKLCIEFNGDLYHANPKTYSPSHKFNYPHYGLTAKDVWDKDVKKLNKLRSLGYDVIIVWESDYRLDKEGTILKCVEYINEICDRQVQSEIARGTRDRCL